MDVILPHFLQGHNLRHCHFCLWARSKVWCWRIDKKQQYQWFFPVRCFTSHPYYSNIPPPWVPSGIQVCRGV